MTERRRGISFPEHPSLPLILSEMLNKSLNFTNQLSFKGSGLNDKIWNVVLYTFSKVFLRNRTKNMSVDIHKNIYSVRVAPFYASYCPGEATTVVHSVAGEAYERELQCHRAQKEGCFQPRKEDKLTAFWFCCRPGLLCCTHPRLCPCGTYRQMIFYFSPRSVPTPPQIVLCLTLSVN